MAETSLKTDRADALIARIEAETQDELDRIRVEAEAEAAAVVKAAHGRARAKVRREIEDLKRGRKEALRREAAHLDTKRRQVRRREARAEIEAGLPALEAAFAELWAEKETRMAWAQAALGLAAKRLRRGAWTVWHPPGWRADETQALAAEVEATTGSAPHFDVDTALLAGLRVEAGEAWLDATPAALMTDREAIGAALLAEVARDREGKE